MRSRSWEGGGYRLQILRKGEGGVRLLLLFAHSFAEGEAGGGL